MIKIRRSTFETNSSSMHSLVIKKTNDYYTDEQIKSHVYINKNGELRVWDDDIRFYRDPFRILTHPVDKFYYLIASYANNNKVRTRLIDMFKNEIMPEINDIVFPTDFSGEIDYGMIDHQSDGFVSNYIDNNDINLKDFILNKKYCIIIDGDEYCEWENMKDSGLVRTEDIEIDINPDNYDFVEKRKYFDEDIEL